MPSKKGKGSSRKGADTKEPGGYEVGYGHPPSEHRFRPGQSGNPSGKMGRKTTEQILRAIMGRRVRIVGHDKTLTAHEAMYLKFIEKALQLNHKAADFIFDRYAPIEARKVALAKEKRRREAAAKFDPEAAAREYEKLIKEGRRGDRDPEGKK
jgi:hypothetical protein